MGIACHIKETALPARPRYVDVRIVSYLRKQSTNSAQSIALYVGAQNIEPKDIISDLVSIYLALTLNSELTQRMKS